MKVVDGIHAAQRQGGRRKSGEIGAFPECQVTHW